MKGFSQKYTLILPLETLSVGMEYRSSNWPLHVTIMGAFAIDMSDTVISQLRAVIERHEPIVVTAGDDAYFGPQKDIQVTLIEANPALEALHNDLVNCLELAGAVFNEPQYIKQGYRAHATVQPHARLTKGEQVRLHEVALIDMFPHDDPYGRRVMQVISL